MVQTLNVPKLENLDLFKNRLPFWTKLLLYYIKLKICTSAFGSDKFWLVNKLLA